MNRIFSMLFCLLIVAVGCAPKVIPGPEGAQGPLRAPERAHRCRVSDQIGQNNLPQRTLQAAAGDARILLDLPHGRGRDLLELGLPREKQGAIDEVRPRDALHVPK